MSLLDQRLVHTENQVSQLVAHARGLSIKPLIDEPSSFVDVNHDADDEVDIEEIHFNHEMEADTSGLEDHCS